MFSEGHCQQSIKKRGKNVKRRGIAEQPAFLSSCLHSAAEAVNSKELKQFGHHLGHPSFQKLALYTPLSGEAHSSLPCLQIPLHCHFGGNTPKPHKQPASTISQGSVPGLDACPFKDIKGNNVFCT